MARVIRPATLADLETVVRFNAAIAEESEGKILDDAILRRGVMALLNDAHKGFYTLVEDDGEVVGQTLITYEWSDWRNGWYWWIQSVYVRADRRKSKVFRSIFQFAVDQARAEGNVVAMRLYVEQENRSAQETYKRLGFQQMHFYLMQKLLDSSE